MVGNIFKKNIQLILDDPGYTGVATFEFLDFKTLAVYRLHIWREFKFKVLSLCVIHCSAYLTNIYTMG